MTGLLIDLPIHCVVCSRQHAQGLGLGFEVARHHNRTVNYCLLFEDLACRGQHLCRVQASQAREEKPMRSHHYRRLISIHQYLALTPKLCHVPQGAQSEAKRQLNLTSEACQLTCPCSSGLQMLLHIASCTFAGSWSPYPAWPPGQRPESPGRRGYPYPQSHSCPQGDMPPHHPTPEHQFNEVNDVMNQ